MFFVHPPWSVPAVSDMVREALRRDTRDGREGDEHQGEEFREGYEGGGREVLVVVPPEVGMGILSIVVRNGEGTGIISKEDAQIVAVRGQRKTIGGVYRRIFGNDAGHKPGRRDRGRLG